MIALYSAMVKYQKLAERTQELALLGNQAQQLTTGLEAMVAGVTADLRPQDTLIAAHSSLLSTFIKSSASRRASRNGRLGLALSDDFASASQAAEAHKAAKNGAVALALCENRVKADLWRKQLQRASKDNLPLIVVRLHEAPTHKATRNGHVPEALEFGMPMIAVDAADVRAIYRVASESIQRARQGRGPTLIDCIDFGRDALGSNPIGDLETVLTKKRILNAAVKKKVVSGVTREANKALRFIQSV
jgi:Dehydrogenase E1 component